MEARSRISKNNKEFAVELGIGDPWLFGSGRLPNSWVVEERG
jgi:hypothetical protein